MTSQEIKQLRSNRKGGRSRNIHTDAYDDRQRHTERRRKGDEGWRM